MTAVAALHHARRLIRQRNNGNRFVNDLVVAAHVETLNAFYLRASASLASRIKLEIDGLESLIQ